ncbi:MAG: MBL fold metallo-hydrolase [Gammaproteobacteria bacterium]|nr:MBL fold metallo-hydrolase [Gammaproteobacteria bacterium]
MRYWLPSLILVLMLPASQAVESVRDYPVEQLAPNTYIIHGPLGFPSVGNQGFMNNPGFVITTKGVVVIDPGSSLQAGRMVLRQLKTITDKPVTHVLNTHVHGDHWLGNHAIADAYPGALFYAHPLMIERAHNGVAQQWLDLMLRSTEGFTAGTVAIIPTHSTANVKELRTGGVSFRFHAPEKAHSGTDVMIEVVEESVLFLGDNVLNERIARMDDASFRGNIAACEAAIALNTRHYVPGHGRSGGIELPKAFQNYLMTLYQEVKRLYEEDLSDFEMKPQIVPLLEPFNRWVNFDDQIGRHISLAILEVEQENF